jgi:hypothetical protein
MKKLFVLVCLVLSFGLIAGCASGKKTSAAPKITVLEKIPSKTPDWVNTDAEFNETKTSYTYRGMSEGYTTLDAAKRAAEANAKTRIAEQVKSTISAEFANVIESEKFAANTGGYLKDIFISSVDKVTISGIVVRASYSERISEVSQAGEKISYRSYALAEISQEDFKKMVSQAFSNAGAQAASNKSAKEALAEAEQRFWEK